MSNLIMQAKNNRKPASAVRKARVAAWKNRQAAERAERQRIHSVNSAKLCEICGSRSFKPAWKALPDGDLACQDCYSLAADDAAAKERLWASIERQEAAATS